jgi:hypothetical protein
MLNITLQFNDLQSMISPLNLSSAEAQSSPQIKNNTHKSPGPGGPFSAFLRPGGSWYSPGGAFRLTLQETDGNLVLQVIDDSSFILEAVGQGPALNPNTQVRWVPVWSPFIQGKGVTEVDFQIDGNLVAYAGSHAVWSTGSSGNENSVLEVQDDGNLVIYKTGMVKSFETRTSVLETPGKNA